MAQDLLQNLRSQALFNRPGRVGVPGGVRAFLFDLQLFQQRVIVPVPEVLHHFIPGVSGEQQRAGGVLGKVRKEAFPPGGWG